MIKVTSAHQTPYYDQTQLIWLEKGELIKDLQCLLVAQKENLEPYATAQIKICRLLGHFICLPLYNYTDPLAIQPSTPLREHFLLYLSISSIIFANSLCGVVMWPRAGSWLDSFSRSKRWKFTGRPRSGIRARVQHWGFFWLNPSLCDSQLKQYIVFVIVNRRCPIDVYSPYFP